MLLTCAIPVVANANSQAIFISDCRGLQNIADNLSDDYELISDINCAGVNFEPIGTYAKPFVGSLNGNGYTIMDFSIINNPNENDYTGLFGRTKGARIENIVFENVDIVNDPVPPDNNYVGTLVGYAVDTQIIDVKVQGKIRVIANPYGGGWVGGLVGYSENGAINDSSSAIEIETSEFNAGGLMGANGGSITNSYSTGNISENGSGSSIGGLVAYNNRGDITSCYATGQLIGAHNAGGLIGNNRGGNISYSYATGDIQDASTAGGIIGFSSEPLNLARSYATGNVEGNQYLGGLIGFIEDAYISDTYAKGKVTSTGNIRSIGGLIGYGNGSVVTSYSTSEVNGEASGIGGLLGPYSDARVIASYWDTETSGQSFSAGGTGKTTQEMYQQRTYESWDFTSVWTINEGIGYPALIFDAEGNN